MMKRNERKIKQLIKEVYEEQILKVYRESVRDLFEAEMFDEVGNQLLSPGLKVRHKGSGYEYTVDHVEGEGENAVVYLRHPEVPRFKPPKQETQLAEADEADINMDGQEDEHDKIDVQRVDLKKAMGIEGEVNDLPARKGTHNDPMYDMKKNNSTSLLKVSHKDFKKEYEVK